MEDPQQARLEVRPAAVGVDQARSSGQRDRHRVDGEVAAGEVRLDARGLDDRQRPGRRVGLPTGPGQVDRRPVATRTLAVPKRSCRFATSISG